MRLISLSQNREALIDDDVFELVSQRSWHYHHTGYARTQYRHSPGTGQQTVMLHHLVIGYPFRGYEVDHINGNKLDNRRENLRVVSIRQNQQNQEHHRKGRLAGVTKLKAPHKRLWRARARKGDRRIFIGDFRTEMEAHQAYLRVSAGLDMARKDLIQAV